MPTGAVDYLTFADSVVSDADETTFFTTHINSVLPVTGTNIIAVELHQANLISSD
jgi:hypothetical protein